MLSVGGEQHEDFSDDAGHLIDGIFAGSSVKLEPLLPNADEIVSRLGDVSNDEGHQVDGTD